MSTYLILTERDVDCLRTLSHHLEFVTQHDLREHWGISRRRGNELLDAGFLITRDVEVADIYIAGPVHRWPVDGLPDCGGLAYRARENYRSLTTRPAKAYFAAPSRTLRCFAPQLRPTKKSPFHDVHECGVMASYWWLRSRWDKLVRRAWRHEKLYSHTRMHGEVVEDALIVHRRHQTPLLGVEYVGYYPASRLERLHSSFAKRQVPYWLFSHEHPTV